MFDESLLLASEQALRESIRSQAHAVAAAVAFIDTAAENSLKPDWEAEAALVEVALAWNQSLQGVSRSINAYRFAAKHLPSTLASWQDGAMSTPHFYAAVSAAHRLSETQSFHSLDERAYERAAELSLGQYKQWLNRLVARLEPDHFEQRHRSAFAKRGVWLFNEEDAMATIQAYLPSVQARRIDAAIEQLARHSDGNDQRTLDQRRADAFVEMLMSNNDTKTILGVVINADTLAGFNNNPASFVDQSDALPADTVRELATNPTTELWQLLTNVDGELIGTRELGRFPTRKLRQLIAFRDGMSQFPLSSVPVERCDIDHTVPYPEGHTEAANLGALDRRAHRLKTEGKISLSQLEPGIFEWKTQTGRTYRARGEPLLDTG